MTPLDRAIAELEAADGLFALKRIKPAIIAAMQDVRIRVERLEAAVKELDEWSKSQ